jgi:enoyl-CoA hydratase/carnithine racemase
MGLVTVERQGGAAVITYANPPFGTMTAAGSEEMFHAISAASADPAVRAIVLTGGLPDIFVRHYDVGELSGLSERLAEGPAAPPAAASAPRPPGFSEMIDALDAAPKPVIAAINGLCMGGGFEMSLACDLRIAGAGVTAIGLPETRIGIFPGGGARSACRG